MNDAQFPVAERPILNRNCRCTLTPLGGNAELTEDLARCVARPITPETAEAVLPVLADYLADYLAATREERSAH